VPLTVETAGARAVSVTIDKTKLWPAVIPPAGTVIVVVVPLAEVWPPNCWRKLAILYALRSIQTSPTAGELGAVDDAVTLLPILEPETVPVVEILAVLLRGTDRVDDVGPTVKYRLTLSEEVTCIISTVDALAHF
jgi:hypothetical protein